jgi:tetratricopeptide (TPR) repeat protein/predicted aspartyl protease
LGLRRLSDREKFFASRKHLRFFPKPKAERPKPAILRGMTKPALVVALAAALVAPLMPLAAQAPLSASGDIQLQLGDLLAGEARYRDAADAYQRALAAASADLPLARRARSGLALMLLRSGDFAGARGQAEQLTRSEPGDAPALSLYGDTLWAFGLFDEAEHAFEASLKASSGDARGHHGRARALTARSRLAEAMVEAQEALRLSPRDPEFHHTVGVIYERQHRFDEAAAAFGNYVNLLPNRDHSEKAQWTRAEIRFLDSFKGRTPVDIAAGADEGWTVPIRIDHDKVMISVRVNGGAPSDFVLDTGAEQTVVSRDVARKRGVVPITYMQTAGVGDVGMRGLQVGRIDSLEVGSLKVKNVPCLIKNPPLGDLPGREPESFSPLALGLSMRVDYARRLLVMSPRLPPASYATELPLTLYRLATVRGTVNGQPATFVVDTGGEVISISQATAGQMTDAGAYRRIPLKVYGTSGWDTDAFLMPNVDLAFDSIHFSKIPVVVLNLRAPSALLGFQLGGIVGHKFLSKYRVTIDLARSVVGLDASGL